MINHIIVLVVLTIFGSSQSFDYTDKDLCDPGEVHTMMMYPVAGPSQACGKVINRGLEPEKIKEIVHLHNKLRRRVARGEEKLGSNGPQPPAANMPDLKWDKELAEIAQRWADQCDYRHDTCRNVDRYLWVGQNVAISKYFGMKYDVTKFVQLWYDEVKDFDSNNVDYYNPHDIPPIKTGHYSQMVWAETTTIGCGSINYRLGRYEYLYLVCNYGPGGNILETKMYEKGQPSNSAVKPENQPTESPTVEVVDLPPDSNRLGPSKKFLNKLIELFAMYQEKSGHSLHLNYTITEM